MKYHVDVKLVFESLDKEHTDKQLKHVMGKIINEPFLDIFLKNPGSTEYARLTK